MTLDDLVSRFRTASRELYNNYFHFRSHDEDPWEANERFELVEELLFRTLVVEPGQLPDISYLDIQHSIRVVAKSGGSAPWALSKGQEPGDWTHPLKCFDNTALLCFMSFHDWDQIGVKDYQYVRVYIADWPQHKELVGRQALIEVQYVRFELNSFSG